MAFAISGRIIEACKIDRITNDETKGRYSMLERLAGILKRRREEEEEYEPERLPIRRCMPDYHMGLYEEEIIEREEAGWMNIPVDPPSKTTRDIIHDKILDRKSTRLNSSHRL